MPVFTINNLLLGYNYTPSVSPVARVILLVARRPDGVEIYRAPVVIPGGQVAASTTVTLTLAQACGTTISFIAYDPSGSAAGSTSVPATSYCAMDSNGNSSGGGTGQAQELFIEWYRNGVRVARSAGYGAVSHGSAGYRFSMGATIADTTGTLANWDFDVGVTLPAFGAPIPLTARCDSVDGNEGYIRVNNPAYADALAQLGVGTSDHILKILWSLVRIWSGTL